MKGGLHPDALRAPSYSGIGSSRPDREAIAQCDRCHAVSTVEMCWPLRFLALKVYVPSEQLLLDAENAWRALDSRAVASRDPGLSRAADRARVRLYELRDDCRADGPLYRHAGCDGRVEIFVDGGAGA